MNDGAFATEWPSSEAVARFAAAFDERVAHANADGSATSKKYAIAYLQEVDDSYRLAAKVYARLIENEPEGEKREDLIAGSDVFRAICRMARDAMERLNRTSDATRRGS